MTNRIHNLFPAALSDTLSPDQRAEFEATIAADPRLAREFETYADAQQGDVAEVHAWLAGAGTGRLPDTYNHMAHEVLRRASEHKRGRLIALFGGVTAAAAAAAIAAIIWLQPGATTETAQPWPENIPGEVSVMDGGHRYFEEELKDFHPAQGVALMFGKDALVQPGEQDARLVSGMLRASTEEASYSILVGDQRIELAQTASIEVLVEPEQFTETRISGHDPVFDSRMLARFGARSLTFTLTVLAGSVTLHAGNGRRTLTAPQTLQSQAIPPRGQPPKVEDVFTHLDANADGVLDANEVPRHMINDFDDDANGDIDLAEFMAHHMPPMPGQMPEDEFARLDRNADGKLDSVEVEQRLIDEMDDDASSDVDPDEFRAHFRPPVEPRVEDRFTHLDVNADGKLDGSELPDDMLKQLDGDGDRKVTPDEFKANHKPPMPSRPEGEFIKLDKNSDGAIDDAETNQGMIDDFDDDASGDVDLDEFRAHWRPRPIKPEDTFAELDKNHDGALDVDELPTAVVTDWDDDQSGEVDISEFKAHQKPPMPGPRAPGQAPGGPGKGPGPK